MELLTPSQSQSESEEDSCYRFELLDTSNWLFDTIFQDAVDATYILHLEGNGRLEQVKEQLKKFQPTRKIYILHNKGYKNCKKSPEINVSTLDLVDGYLTIFKHSQKNGYGNVLILEDDFIFHDDILLPEHNNEISRFLKEHKDEELAYRIGCLPTHLFPVDIYAKHYVSYLCGGTHCLVYTHKYRENTLKKTVEEILDWDYYNAFRLNYMYYRPLCYQLHAHTENQTNWGYGTIFHGMVQMCVLYIFKIVKLDTQPEPGYSNLYKLFKILNAFFVLLVIGIILWWVILPLFSIVFRWWKKSRGKRPALFTRRK